jgi:hypothetical protein
MAGHKEKSATSSWCTAGLASLSDSKDIYGECCMITILGGQTNRDYDVGVVRNLFMWTVSLVYSPSYMSAGNSHDEEEEEEEEEEEDGDSTYFPACVVVPSLCVSQQLRY